MSHSHHSCACEHADVRFCKHCHVVYCKDCNMEWAQRSTWYYNYPYYTSGTLKLGGQYKDTSMGTYTASAETLPTVTTSGHTHE